MTVSATVPRNDYLGTGLVATYDYTFRIFAATDLRLTVQDTAGVETALVYLTDYTVTGVNSANGGTITLLAGVLTSGYMLTIRFDRTPIQSTDLRNQGSFFAETHETKFDELTRYVQALRDLLGRSLHLPETEDGTPGATTIPTETLRKNRYAYFDSAGNLTAVQTLVEGAITVSAFVSTILDDANAAAVRATIGVPTLAEVLAAAVFTDSVFRVAGSSDATKLLAHEVDALTTATTRKRFAVDEDANDGQSWEVQNLTIVATVGTNALTVALKTKNGTDPSATDPIIFKFRNATIGTGDYTTIALTAALSVVGSSGSTLGTASATAHRVYVGIANDAGTLRLFLYNPLVSATLSLAGLSDDLVYSSTAEGGIGAADSAQVLYSGVAFTNKAVRLLGYLESTQATAGTWATPVSKTQVLGPGVKRTGDTIQTARTPLSAVATGTTNIPIDDTIPQISEGDEYIACAITPKSAINLLAIEHVGSYGISTASGWTIALFQDATANALAALADVKAINGRANIVKFNYPMRAGTIISTTLRFRAGGTGGVTTTFNGEGGVRLYGGVSASFMTITEVMV